MSGPDGLAAQLAAGQHLNAHRESREYGPRVSIARKRPWWVLYSSSGALAKSIILTVWTALNWLLVFPDRLWAARVLVLVSSGLLAVAGWASYIYHQRHPDAELTTVDRGNDR